MRGWTFVLTILVATSVLTVRSNAAEIVIDSVVINLIAEAEVPAEEAGVLAELAVQEGARVKAGDLLARLDDRDAALEVSKAKIILAQATDMAANDVKLRRAKQTLKLAQLELMRSEEANKALEKVVSPTQIEKLKIDVENAQLEIEQAEKELATAQRGVEAAKNDLQIAERTLQRRRLLAPIDGVVVDVRRQAGEWLKPGETMIRVVRDDRLRAEGFIPVDELTAEMLGAAVQLNIKLASGETLSVPGKITFVSPETNPINRQVRLWAEVENTAGKLRAGTSAKMVIETPAKSPAPTPKINM